MHFVTFILEKDWVKSSLKNIYISTYFENIIIKFYILYVLNTYVKLLIKILFTILFINLFLYIILYHKNLKFKHLKDEIYNDLWSFENFASKENIRKIVIQ